MTPEQAIALEKRLNAEILGGVYFLARQRSVICHSASGMCLAELADGRLTRHSHTFTPSTADAGVWKRTLAIYREVLEETKGDCTSLAEQDEVLVTALRRAEKRASLASKVATAAVVLATAQALIAWAL